MNWALLWNSLLVAGGSSLGALMLGMAGALWLSGLSAGWRRAFLALAIVALALPPFLVTNCWLDLLGQTGLWRRWLPVNIYSLPGTVWVLTMLLWPIPLLLILGDLQKLDPSLVENEAALGGWPLIRWLLLPIAWPAVVQGGVVTFVIALNNFAVPAILQTKVFPAELWVSFNTTFDYLSALKLSWPLLVVPLLLLACLAKSRIAWPRLTGGVPANVFRRQLGVKWFLGVAMVSLFAVLLAVGVPFADLAFARRTWAELPGAFEAGKSGVANSLLYAFVGGSLALAMGWGAWRSRAGMLLWPLFLLPGVVLGMALIFVFNREFLVGFYQSAGIVLLALGLRYAALGWGGARQAMRSLDTRLSEFAELNGATRWQAFRHVIWPQIAAPAAALWMVLYLLCLWDVETLVLIVPPGGETLALRIFNLLHYGHAAQVNALCMILLGLALAPLALGALVRRSSGLMATIAGLIAGGFLLLVGSGCGPALSRSATIQSRFFSSVEVIGGRGTALGQFNKPRSVAVDAQDNLYVVDMTGRVQKFSSNGVYLTSWQMPQIEKGRPKGMCRDSAGNIVVVEPHYNRVNHFAPDGKLVAQWGQAGTNEGQLCLPRSATVNSHGDILVCEYTAVDRVQEFSALGKAWKMAFGHSGLGQGELNRPEGLAVDRLDQVYVADSCNHRIQVFSSDGKYLRSYGSAGSGLGQLSYPYDIQIDPAGFQFVCEFGNSRLQIFDPQGKSVEVIGGAGPAPGQFANPWSLAFDSAGNLYVADSQNHRVQKFIRKGS